jgi:hypothetical protein
MPNYANAKIYQVISPNHPVPYIGSTTQPLCKRMASHRKKNNSCSSRILIESGDAYIELIEEFPCENKEQLNKREGELIRERECVNHQVAGRTRSQWIIDVEYGKRYYDEHREQLKAKRRARHAKKKAQQLTVDVLQEQGQEDIHSQPNEAPQPL